MNELNLLPSHIKQKKLRRLNVIQGGLICVIIFAIMAAAAYYPYAKLKKLNNEEAALKSSLLKERTAKTENEKLKKETAQLKEYIDKIDMIKNNKVSTYTAIKNIEKYFPKDVIISNFSYTKGVILISATSKQYDSINELQANLQESKEFPNSVISSITANDKNSEWTFTLNIGQTKGEVK